MQLHGRSSAGAARLGGGRPAAVPALRSCSSVPRAVPQQRRLDVVDEPSSSSSPSCSAIAEDDRQGWTSGGATRRAALLAGILAAAPSWPIAAARAFDEAAEAPAAATSTVQRAPQQPSSAGKMVELYDPVLAYRFKYPVETVSGKPLKMITTREPEKYSSAAPLSADARQRIVAELLDLTNFVTISVTVGPASGVLREQQPAQYKPYDVALTVLVDRSTSRLTSGQRTALNDVERAVREVKDGSPYYVYEHVSQGSPTMMEAGKKETYRHALSVTAVRPDSQGNPFLYTLNLSCRQELWDDVSPLFEDAVTSFALATPTSEYIAPDVNPWQFW